MPPHRLLFLLLLLLLLVVPLAQCAVRGRVLDARALGDATYSPYLTNDSHFPSRPGVYRLDTEIFQDAPCSAQEPCCGEGAEFVIEQRVTLGVEFTSATCQQCLPGWFADRRQRIKYTPSYDAVDAVQTVTCTGTGGTFTLSQGGKTTAPIAFDASAVNVESALVAVAILPNAGTVTFTEATPFVPATDTTAAVSATPAKTAACDALGSNNMTITFVGTATPKALVTSDVAPPGSPPLTSGSIVHAQLTAGRAKVVGGIAYTDEAPACTRCPHGKYGTAHRANCTACLSNEHTNQHTRLHRTDCLVCPTGEYYAWKEGCFGCWPNYFCPNGHDRTLCPQGTRSEARQTQCSPIPRIGFNTIVEPPPSLATPCTTQQHRADLACREHGKFNQYQCGASTANIKQIRTNLTDDHDSKVDMLDISCIWCPSFNDSGVIADRCLAKQYCKAAVGLSSCWDPSAAPAARSPGALALALGLTLASAVRLVVVRENSCA